MVKKLLLLLLTTCLFDGLSAQDTENKLKGLTSITQQQLSGPLEFLSSDLLEGRETGTRGASLAAQYIASQFKILGLKTINQTKANRIGDYLNEVKLISEELTNATLSITTEGSTIHFEQEIDFSPLKIEQSLTAKGTVIFGGYGLGQGPENKFSKNMRGKILLRAKGFPDANDTTSVAYHLFSKLSSSALAQKKDLAARQAGIIAILEFDPSLAVPFRASNPQPDAYAEKEMTKHSSGIYKREIRLANTPIHNNLPVFAISHRVMSVIEPNWETKLKTWDRSGMPKRQASETTREVTLSATMKNNLFTCNNVVGCLEGKNTNEIVVIGAHYDHLGFYDGYLWNGADDNGSGTVGMLALAKAFISSGQKPNRTLIFAAWTGEERGLHGSTHFLETYENPEKIIYYHNYDMIGRSADPSQPDSNVSLIYTEAWKEVKRLSQSNNETYALNLNIRYGAAENPVWGSDNAPFARKGIPIMWFHTGGHPDYHMPSDHVEKIDWQKMEAIVKLSFLDLWDLTM